MKIRGLSNNRSMDLIIIIIFSKFTTSHTDNIKGGRRQKKYLNIILTFEKF